MPESGIRQLGDTGDHEDWQGLYRCNHRTDPPDRRLPRERIIQQLRSNGSVQVNELAATLVPPGCRLILDSGTTTLEVARHLREHQEILVMTNGMNVANALLEAEGVELLMTGGHLRRKSLSFYGAQAEQSLQNYHFDMLFLGVDGIDLERGVSTHHEDEARLNRCMCQVAERIIVVTDSSKFGRRSLHKIIDTPRIHTLITDDAVPADILSGLHNAGIEVMLVPAG